MCVDAPSGARLGRYPRDVRKNVRVSVICNQQWIGSDNPIRRLVWAKRNTSATRPSRSRAKSHTEVSWKNSIGSIDMPTGRGATCIASGSWTIADDDLESTVLRANCIAADLAELNFSDDCGCVRLPDIVYCHPNRPVISAV